MHACMAACMPCIVAISRLLMTPKTMSRTHLFSPRCWTCWLINQKELMESKPWGQVKVLVTTVLTRPHLSSAH